MILEFLRRRRLKKAFGKYLVPEQAAQLAGAPLAPDVPAPVQRELEFVYVAIDAPDSATYSQRAAITSAAALKHHGLVHSILPILVVGFGTVHPAQADSREKFLRELSMSLPGVASAVHGRVIAAVGSHGGGMRFDFGFWWPGVQAALSQLAALPPGTIKEFAPPRSTAG